MADFKIRAKGNTNHVIAHVAGLPKRVQDELIRATTEATAILERHAVAQIHRRTGHTAASIHSSVRPTTRGAHGEVYSDDPVARYLEYGTGIYGPRHRSYPIVPRNGRALKFEVGGRIHFAKRVEAPGMQAQHWVEKAKEAAEPEIMRLYNERVLSAL